MPPESQPPRDRHPAAIEDRRPGQGDQPTSAGRTGTFSAAAARTLALFPAPEAKRATEQETTAAARPAAPAARQARTHAAAQPFGTSPASNQAAESPAGEAPAGEQPAEIKARPEGPFLRARSLNP